MADNEEDPLDEFRKAYEGMQGTPDDNLPLLDKILADQRDAKPIEIEPGEQEEIIYPQYVASRFQTHPDNETSPVKGGRSGPNYSYVPLGAWPHEDAGDLPGSPPDPPPDGYTIYNVLGYTYQPSSSSVSTAPGIDCSVLCMVELLSSTEIDTYTKRDGEFVWDADLGSDTIYWGTGSSSSNLGGPQAGKTGWFYSGTGTYEDSGDEECPLGAVWRDPDSSDLFSLEVGACFPPSSSSSKSAVTEFRDEWIGWYCSEEPQAMFRDTYEFPLHDGRGIYRLPDEFDQSVDPSTIAVESVLTNTTSYNCGFVFERGGALYVAVEAKTSWLRKKASRAIVRVAGVRSGAYPRYKRFTRGQAFTNDLFWGQAQL